MAPVVLAKKGSSTVVIETDLSGSVVSVQGSHLTYVFINSTKAGGVDCRII